MENNPQFRSNFYNLGNFTEKKTLHQNLEEHSLSLRKKKNNKQKIYELPPELLSDVPYKISALEIEQKICNEQIFIQYKNSNNEKDTLGLLFQMLLTGNDDLIKFSVAKIRDFLINIEEKKFHEKNYDDEFNDKLIKFLFELMFNKSNDLFLLSYISFLLNKLAIFLRDNKEQNHFFNIYFENFGKLLHLAKNFSCNEPNIKNSLYILVDKIFLSCEEFIMQLEKFYPDFAFQIHSELKNLDQNKFVKNMTLISTLLQIIHNCFYNQICSNYFFSNSNDNMEELNAENIIKFVQKLLNFSYQKVIFEQEILCIQNFLYLFMDKDELFENKILKNKVRNMIYDLKLEKRIVPMIYDNTINDLDLRLNAIQILINAIYICPKQLCETFIKNNISEQIIKLENYLLAQTQFKNKTKDLYNLLLDLIYNLIEDESANIIDNLTRENNCISLLFKLQKIPFYAKESKSIIKIFNVLISSNHKYIRTLLISEGICELYKNILENEPNNENVEIIIKNLISMVNYSDKFGKENSNETGNLNLILMHLEKIGVYEILNNLKSRNDLSDASISAINEISSLLCHSTT